MEKQDNLQLELFSQSKESPEIKKRAFNHSFLTYIWNYEKTILVIITFVITGIVSFSLGVERGKKITALKSNARFDVASGVSTSTPKAPPKPIAPEENYKAVGKDNSQDLLKQSYTIQLASYKTKTYAQKEAERLKKRGLSTLFLAKGNYIVLCVGQFSDKETAQAMLSELKKQYQGCYIRRL